MLTSKTYLFALFFVFTVCSYGQTITGRVIDLRRQKPLDFATVYLYQSNSDTTYRSYLTGDKGDFSFQNLPKSTYKIQVSYLGYGSKTIENINLLRDTVIVIDLSSPCKYDSSKDNKTCPTCHQQDMVLRIAYGQLIFSDSLAASRQGIDYYVGGCKVTPCDPNWYCKRDSTKF